MLGTDRDLSALWLPLLRRLTDALPDWGIWKNADAALYGSGDIDSAAPERDWPAIVAEFRAWARAHGHGPVAACTHVPHVLFLVALTPDRRTFVELDVNDRKYFRGSTMFRAADLAPLMEIDERGFRRVRPGAEAVILLVQNGATWGGRPNPGGLERKRVAEWLARDPEGVRLAARAFFGAASGALVRAADAVLANRWDRAAALTVEAYSVAKAFAEPAILAGRIRNRNIKIHDPLLYPIFHSDRALPDDAEAWLRSVARTHTVYADV